MINWILRQEWRKWMVLKFARRYGILISHDCVSFKGKLYYNGSSAPSSEEEIRESIEKLFYTLVSSRINTLAKGCKEIPPRDPTTGEPDIMAFEIERKIDDKIYHQFPDQSVRDAWIIVLADSLRVLRKYFYSSIDKPPLIEPMKIGTDPYCQDEGVLSELDCELIQALFDIVR